MCHKPSDFIWNCSAFCIWNTTSEGEGFWWAISSLWKEYCIRENLFFYEDKIRLIYACNKLLCNTKKLVDPTVYDDSYISSKYRNRVINMRDRINKLIKEYEKE